MLAPPFILGSSLDPFAKLDLECSVDSTGLKFLKMLVFSFDVSLDILKRYDTFEFSLVLTFQGMLLLIVKLAFESASPMLGNF